MLLAKICQILLYLDLVKIRLEIMVSDFAEKKETCFDFQKRNFLKSKKSSFPKGLAHALGQKMPFFLYLDLVKIRLEILLNYFEERKETFQTIKKRIFQVQKIALFLRG